MASTALPQAEGQSFKRLLGSGLSLPWVRLENLNSARNRPPARPMSPSIDHREHREMAAEMKFLVPHALAARVREWARERLAPDPHAADQSGDGYRVTSIYFDTAAFDVVHRRGSYGRSKHRIRRYGTSDIAFLERKLKTRGLLAKRRTTVPLEDLDKLAGETVEALWAGAWFLRRLRVRALQPVCQISYQRTARVAMASQGPIRLTLDHDVRALPANGLTFDETSTGTKVLEDRVILELKFRREMPLVFKLLVEEFALTPSAISKYRWSAASLGLAKCEVENCADRSTARAWEPAYA